VFLECHGHVKLTLGQKKEKYDFLLILLSFRLRTALKYFLIACCTQHVLLFLIDVNFSEAILHNGVEGMVNYLFHLILEFSST